MNFEARLQYFISVVEQDLKHAFKDSYGLPNVKTKKGTKYIQVFVGGITRYKIEIATGDVYRKDPFKNKFNKHVNLYEDFTFWWFGSDFPHVRRPKESGHNLARKQVSANSKQSGIIW